MQKKKVCAPAGGANSPVRFHWTATEEESLGFIIRYLFFNKLHNVFPW